MTGKLKKQGKANRRTPRRRPQPRGQGFGMKSALLGSVAVTLAFGAAGGFGLYRHLGTEQPDELGCYQRPNQSEVAVFVDASLGGQSDAQIRDYREGIARAYEQAPANARVMLFSTARDVQASVVDPVATLCKPAETAAEQALLGAPDKPGPYLARQAVEARATFDEAVDDLIQTALDADQRAGDSPILEQLRGVSRYPGFQGNDRTLVAITDGVQNTRLAHFCYVQGDMPSFERFTQRSGYADVEPRSLVETDVTLLLVENRLFPHDSAPFCSNQELRDWWRDYFEGNGADSIDLVPLRYWVGS